jgi:protein-export SecD/SecF family membrane protein
VRTKRSKSFLAILIVLIIAATAYVINDVANNEALSLGLDLEGGVYVLLEAQPRNGEAVNRDSLERAKAIIQNRVDQLGTKEPEITIEGGNRIRVAIPGVQDQEQVLDLVGQTALLEFKSGKKVDGETVYETIITGDALEEAVVKFDNQNKPIVSLTLNDDAGDKMRAFTSDNVGQTLYITLDGVPISTPVIEEAVGKTAAISGNFSDEEAAELALLLRSGALPVPLVARETRAIGPRLGRDSLDKSLVAGMIGAGLVLLFMIIFYKGFGGVANIALIAYMTIVLFGLKITDSTLTLPGIAGLILGLGMAVDANIIIFERIKEELQNGRALRIALENGFSRAIITIVDANITTLIAAGVLYWFGTGPVRGFAVTLTMSIIGSMITAVFITRWLLRFMADSNIIKTAKSIGRL